MTSSLPAPLTMCSVLPPTAPSLHHTCPFLFLEPLSAHKSLFMPILPLNSLPVIAACEASQIHPRPCKAFLNLLASCDSLLLSVELPRHFCLYFHKVCLVLVICIILLEQVLSSGVNPSPYLAQCLARTESSVNKYNWIESLGCLQYRETPKEVEKKKAGLWSTVA